MSQWLVWDISYNASHPESKTSASGTARDITYQFNTLPSIVSFCQIYCPVHCVLGTNVSPVSGNKVNSSIFEFPSLLNWTLHRMRTCGRLETLQPWCSCLWFKSPRRFHDNSSLFVLWLVSTEGVLWVDNSKIKMTALTVSNNGVIPPLKKSMCCC